MGASLTVDTASLAGRRPANRRELILSAAASLFAEHGFDLVGMSDIAEAVAVRPSALYRHFASKDALLTAVLGDTAGQLEAVLESARGGTIHEALRTLVSAARARRSAVLLWEREGRGPATDSAESQRLRTLRSAFVDLLAPAAATSPDRGVHLRASMALAVTLSPATHGVAAPDERFASVLSDMASRLLTTAVEQVDSAEAPVGGARRRASKRGQIQAVAFELFLERGFSQTTIEDVAAAAHIAASGVYHHYDSKAAILLDGLHRGNGYLQTTLDSALADNAAASAALAAVIGTYADFAYRHPAMLSLLYSDTPTLGEAATSIVIAQREYLAEWAALLSEAHPDMSATTAGIAVRAATSALNELGRPGMADSGGSGLPRLAAELVATSLNL